MELHDKMSNSVSLFVFLSPKYLVSTPYTTDMCLSLISSSHYLLITLRKGAPGFVAAK